MRPHLAQLLGVAPLWIASTARADHVIRAAPEAPALVRAVVFEPATPAGPRRAAEPSALPHDASAREPAVLDWVSPVFVWIEEGYVYAEASLRF